MVPEEGPETGTGGVAPQKGHGMPPSIRRARGAWLRRVGAAACAISLYALLLDTAVETLLSGSSLRWMVAGAAAAYLGLSALLWRRLSWGAKAGSSWLAFLAILAFTAWQPGGVVRGAVLLRQPTSTVLTAITALAVLGSAVLLVRAQAFPLWARIIGALLAAYAVGALSAGIAAGTLYPDLLRGRGAWERLPFWLQGPFLGALVLVPLAGVVGAAHVVLRVRERLVAPPGVQVASLWLCVALAAAGLRAPAGETIAGRAPRPFLPEPTLDRSAYLDGARRLLETSGLRSTDVGIAAEAIGSDPAALVAFVRTVAFDPYRGSQRGALGTLMARGGNALDRSLLLASLLQHHGHRPRLVHGRLSDPEARRLLDLARRPAVAQSPAVQPMSDEEAARVSGLPAQDLRSLRRAVEAKNLELKGVLRERVQRDVAALQRHLETIRFHLRPAAGPTLEDVRHHFWVQVEAGGQWRDLDPLAPPDSVGERLTEPAEEVPMDPLPEEWVQSLRLRLVATYRTDGVSSDDEVLAATFRVPDLVGRWIALGFSPQDGGEPPLPETANAFGAILIAGDRPHRGGTVYLDASRARRTGPAVLFGAGTGDDARRPLERVRLEFTLGAPGTDDVRIVRTVVHAPAKTAFDSAAHLERARMELFSLYRFVVAPGPFSTEWLASLHLATLRRLDAGHEAVVPFDLLYLANGLVLPEVGEAVGQPHGLRRYSAHPLLLGQRIRFRKKAGGQWVMVTSVDLLYSRAEIMTEDPLVAVRQGVLAAHLERLLFEGLEVANTTVVFERSRARAAVLRPGDPGDLKGLRLSSEARAFVEEDLAAGYAVVVPAEGVRIAGDLTTGWWRVGPDGETLGRMESGQGEGLTEKIILSLPSAYALGATILCPKEGLTRGPCDACAIMISGALGALLGFAGVIYVLWEEANFGLWILLRVAGGVGVAAKLDSCLRQQFGPSGGEK